VQALRKVQTSQPSASAPEVTGGAAKPAHTKRARQHTGSDSEDSDELQLAQPKAVLAARHEQSQAQAVAATKAAPKPGRAAPQPQQQQKEALTASQAPIAASTHQQSATARQQPCRLHALALHINRSFDRSTIEFWKLKAIAVVR
jgi:hypothetical protein